MAVILAMDWHQLVESDLATLENTKNMIANDMLDGNITQDQGTRALINIVYISVNHELDTLIPTLVTTFQKEYFDIDNPDMMDVVSKVNRVVLNFFDEIKRDLPHGYYRKLDCEEPFISFDELSISGTEIFGLLAYTGIARDRNLTEKFYNSNQLLVWNRLFTTQQSANDRKDYATWVHNIHDRINRIRIKMNKWYHEHQSDEFKDKAKLIHYYN